MDHGIAAYPACGSISSWLNGMLLSGPQCRSATQMGDIAIAGATGRWRDLTEPLRVSVKNGQIIIDGKDLSPWATSVSVSMGNSDAVRVTIELVNVEITDQMLVERIIPNG